MQAKYKYVLALFVILALYMAGSKREIIKGERELLFLEGDTLLVKVNIEGGVYIRQGHPSGFHYELLNRFAQNEKCDVMLTPKDSSNSWNELLAGDIDILVINEDKEVIPEEFSDFLISSVVINDNQDVWVVRKDDLILLQQLNYWFNYFKQRKEYNQLVTRYYRRYRGISISSPGGTSVLSPYDEIIKRHSKNIGWDWRLLASLIYQESKFSMNASSSHGAHGLMQIKQATADQFNVNNIFDPEQNVKAGTLLIKRLQKMFDDPQIDSLNRLKFVLAAYNAGEGRVIDMRKLAVHKGVNPNDWNEVKELIPQMRDKSLLPVGILKLGSFRGGETMRFVDEVLNRYQLYSTLVKK